MAFKQYSSGIHQVFNTVLATMEQVPAEVSKGWRLDEVLEKYNAKPDLFFAWLESAEFEITNQGRVRAIVDGKPTASILRASYTRCKLALSMAKARNQRQTVFT
jgi:hypothetical protein